MNLQEFDTIPEGATTTCRGSILLTDIIEQIPYDDQSKYTFKYKNKTLEEFKISPEELKDQKVVAKHKYDHVQQNIKLAPLQRENQSRTQFFKQTKLFWRPHSETEGWTPRAETVSAALPIVRGSCSC